MQTKLVLMQLAKMNIDAKTVGINIVVKPVSMMPVIIKNIRV